MDVVFIGDSINPKLKVFILAGQHGDEKGSRRIAEILISHLIKINEFSDICVAVLSNANPDGGHRKQRKAYQNRFKPGSFAIVIPMRIELFIPSSSHGSQMLS